MSQRLQELELHEKRTPEPPTETVDRVWIGVQRQIASGDAPLELGRAPLIAELPGRVVPLKLIIGGALVLLGIVGAGVVGSRWRGEKTADVPAEITPDVPIEKAPPSPPVVVQQPQESPPAVEAPPPAVEPELEPEPEPEPKPKPKQEPKPEPKPRTLADEVALIEAISKALKQAEWKSVLKLVAEHERDFANGNFVEERDAAKVRAQCRSDALDAGRKGAERFSERWPSSIHRATIRQDCEL